MRVLPSRMALPHVCAVPSEARRGQQTPKTGSRDTCELPFLTTSVDFPSKGTTIQHYTLSFSLALRSSCSLQDVA